MSQNSLAFAYCNRVFGNRADNIKAAINAYELALQIFKHDIFPVDCRRTGRNLADIHFDHQSWSEAANFYIIALEAAKFLYQSCIFLDSKAAELASYTDLPRLIAYALARIKVIFDSESPPFNQLF
jgi:hypothetical protein